MNVNYSNVRANRRIRAVLFDLDGTLIDSAVDFAKLKRESIRLLKDLGFDTGELSEKMKTYEIMAWIHRQIDEGKYAVPYTAVAERMYRIWDSIELESSDRAAAITGADLVLRTLRGRGILIGVATRGSRPYAVKVLRKVGLLPFVDVVVARGDTVNPKPHPDPLVHAMALLNVSREETVMVGDSQEDSECARLADVRFIGISNRSSDQASFQSLWNVSSIAELLGLLDKLDSGLISSIQS
jgi:HAD superfamily hydrolase (TIGR01549 family)